MFSIDWSILQQSLPLLAQGAMVTLKITITAIAFGMVIGTLLAVARISVYAPMRWLSAAYVNCFRSIPLVMVLLWFYLIVPQFLTSFLIFRRKQTSGLFLPLWPLPPLRRPTMQRLCVRACAAFPVGSIPQRLRLA